MDLSQDVPGQTSRVYHDVDVMGAKLIKQHPYRVNSTKLNFSGRRWSIIMLTNGIIESSSSEWSSSCVPVLKVMDLDPSISVLTSARSIPLHELLLNT